MIGLSLPNQNQDSWEDLVQLVSPYTLSDSQRLGSLYHLAETLKTQGISGDFVECGVYKGGSAAILARSLSENTRIWLFDSFQGMPETTERDGHEAAEWVGACVGQIEDVNTVMNTLNISQDQYLIRPGWFEETFQDTLPDQVSLLHCDADWYDSVTLVLETFYPRMPRGGCVVLDDFGYWEGCREAFYDFCFRHNEKPLLERVGTTQAYWIKGKTHTRHG
ncbi:TylF/MycF/NovP-related O-methyltransferase [Thermosynechococcaceae cyanobacterium BACA0444]|uniref:TylF/MycF/NovP-related O-methyltransferase n=1 Tax=Pseudocalidococcus azoricus BACA0444 TaxID=2918990 RepID=A0AAE4FPN0_9CYAN|nr:TylF/MycF/NovP-related O-methyltransferase [Pseudocalidococcus azoricus]MDS3859434.1 TylF/MycF/NovP-related O-methyltransferase [Pseudocalidococcus azoricus BACA0444]